ncbi:NosD domain-containing protein [Rhizobium wuzhouense]|nr:NosD domain-containing protein [Rhizobium wuzhouense]
MAALLPPSAGRRLRMALLSACLAWAVPASASIESEVDMARTIVTESTVKLDAERDPHARVRLLDEAVDAIGVLEGLGRNDQADDGAQKALQDLAAQAITPDVLRLSLVEALTALIGPGDAGLQADLDAKAAMETIRDPAYRSAGWSALAAAHVRAGQEAEAERLATLAIEEARAIERDATRDGALNAAVLVFPRGKLPEGILEIATNSVVLARTRAEMYQTVALDALAAEGMADPAPETLTTLAKAALAAKDPARALVLAQALDRDEDVRAEFLDGILHMALDKGEDLLALRAAKSMSRDRDQNKALRQVIDARIDRSKALRAREIVPLLLTAKARIDADIAIAKDLRRQGYVEAGREILLQNAKLKLDDPNATANLVSALATFAEFGPAQTLARALPAGDDRSFAMARLVKGLADDDLLDEATKLLSEISREEDQDYARSGIARALVKRGDTQAATASLAEIGAGANRDRVLEALADHAVEKGNLGLARDYLAQATGKESRCRILIEIALATQGKASAREILDEALALLANEKDVDDSRAEIAIAFARIGELARADSLLDSLTDEGARRDAESEIADLLVKQGALAPAEGRLGRLPADLAATLRADLAYASFEKTGEIESFVTSVAALPWQARVPALRRMAEARAKALDVKGWLNDPQIDPLASTTPAAAGQPADFTIGRHQILAPAPSTRALPGVSMPDIFEHDAAMLRGRVPAPDAGVGHLAILGFSPFSLEAFKLSTGGEAAIHQVQLSQQMTWPRYIAVEKGVVTLGTLLRDLPETSARRLLVVDGDDLLVRVPIIVLPGATLLMSGTEFSQYKLGVQSGAFIAVAGRLVVQDAEIVGYDEIAGRPAVGSDKTRANFRPFITAWGGSDIQIAGSRLAMLGYDSSKAFGLTQSSGAAVQSLYAFDDNRPTGNIVDNSFENLRYGYYSYEVDHVRVIGNEYRDNIIYGIDPHDRSRHLLIALNTAYGSQKKHGIIVSREVDDSFIVGNVSLHNKGSGIMLDRTSVRNIVYANTAVANDGDGLTFYESGCNIAAANDLSRNRRAGFKIRNSADVGMYDNRVDANTQSGADIYVADLRQSPEGHTRNFELDPYQMLVTAVISGNLFSENADAINVAGAAQLQLDGNMYRRQRDNIFAGDLRQLSPFLLRLRETSALLTDDSCEPEEAVQSCNFGGWPHPPRKRNICTGMMLSPAPAATSEAARDG